jgi:hypothetical protein
VFLAVTMSVISSCYSTAFEPYLHEKPGEEMSTDIELRGAHYAKLNSIGCLQYDDLEMTKNADFDTIDNLIRSKRCFVIQAGKDILIQERIKGDVVSVKFKGTTQIFYTLRSNLVRE